MLRLGISRGVGLGAGKIFVGQLDAKLVALDQSTGKVVWSIQGEDPNAGLLAWSGAPLVLRRHGDFGLRAAATWAFAAGSKHIDADDRQAAVDVLHRAGPGRVRRRHLAADSEYLEVRRRTGLADARDRSGAGPALLLHRQCRVPIYNGASAPGDNLFTASIVALEVKTGKYRWHFQQVHHDIWDYDSPNPVVLFDAPYQGRMRKGIAEISKTGWVYILDRATGKPLLGIDERPRAAGAAPEAPPRPSPTPSATRWSRSPWTSRPKAIN